MTENQDTIESLLLAVKENELSITEAKDKLSHYD